MSKQFDNWDSETGTTSKKFEGYGYTVPSNSPLDKILSLLKKPVTLVILFLASCLVAVSLKFGALQKEIHLMETSVHSLKN